MVSCQAKLIEADLAFEKIVFNRLKTDNTYRFAYHHLIIFVKKYKSIFFDLDHTLWDFETNSREALSALHKIYKLESHRISHDEFLIVFKKINLGLWNLFDTGQIKQEVIRTQRFHQIFQEFGVNEYELSLKFSAEYVSELPKKKNLLPHAKVVLDYLISSYPLHIITNGFSEIQTAKLTSGGVLHYFESIVTSESTGHRKPAKEIFEYALYQNNLQPHEVVMIGDDLTTDMGGAKNASLDTIFFNPERIKHDTAVTHEIASLKELFELL